MWRAIRSVSILFGFLGVCGGTHAQGKIIVGTNVQVSKANESFRHQELLACADFHHSERLIVGSIVDYMDKFNPWTVAYVSFDGGKSWAIGVQNRPPDDNWSEDPACAYGPDGSAYFVALSGNYSLGGLDHTDFYQSPDGGKKWLPPSTVYGAFDRPYVTVDSTGGKYNDRIYVAHNGLDGIALQRSLDEGKHFLGPVLAPNLEDQQIARASELLANPGNTVVLSTGTVVSLVFKTSTANDRGFGRGILNVVRSSDGGEHYKDDVKIADYTFHFDRLHFPLTIPNIAVDSGSSFFKDRLYAVWQDTLEGDSHLPARERTTVSERSLISYSSDGGQTWAKPKRINNVANAIGVEGAAEFQTTVAVNKDGVVGVMWYEGFETDTSQGYTVRFAASLDGGVTWTPNVKVSEAPCVFPANATLPMTGSMDHTTSRPWSFTWWSPISLSSGETAGLVADATGVFHAFWVDNRTGLTQVWTAPITVPGLVYRNGSEELADLDDLSDNLSLTITHSAFDPHSGKFSANLSLKNVSGHTIYGPLKMRILDLGSAVGTPEVLNSENVRPSEGAILNLSEYLQRNALKPGGSIEVTLNLRIANAVLRSEGKWHMVWQLLTLDARFFGKSLTIE